MKKKFDHFVADKPGLGSQIDIVKHTSCFEIPNDFWKRLTWGDVHTILIAIDTYECAIGIIYLIKLDLHIAKDDPLYKYLFTPESFEKYYNENTNGKIINRMSSYPPNALLLPCEAEYVVRRFP